MDKTLDQYIDLQFSHHQNFDIFFIYNIFSNIRGNNAFIHKCAINQNFFCQFIGANLVNIKYIIDTGNIKH